jgi:predicted extracellular nuclease
MLSPRSAVHFVLKDTSLRTAHSFARFVIVVCLLFACTAAFAAGGDVVISQLYGGGGNSGASLKNDFIEVFNRSGSAVDITGWSVQYASATGTSWQKTTLSGILQPGQYYLVQEAQGAGGTTNLPTPDATGNIAMSATAGKVALMKNDVVIVSGTSSPIGDPNLSDFVGFGSTANAFEGSAPAPTLSNTVAATRTLGGCSDSDRNSIDFFVNAPNPRNTASPLNGCGLSTPPSGSGSANPSSAYGGQSVLFTVNVTPGSNPSSPVTTVSANLSSIGGGFAQVFYNDGTHGDVTAGDSTWSFAYTVPSGLTLGAKSISVSIVDALVRGGSASIALTIVSPPPSAVAVHDIQGPGLTSPLVNQIVNTSGIVTARKSNGFFLQTPDALADADPNTSEGIFVFTSSTPSVSAQIGNLVSVVGTVQEFIPSSDLSSPPVTELGGSPTVTLISTGNPLPAPIALTAADTSPSGSIQQLEKYEGMRVHVDSLTVTGPTDGNVSEANATSNSTGIFYGVITGTARPFREPGIEVPDPLPSGAPATVPRFDANPERLRVDTKGQAGSTVLDVTANATVTNITGPLDYGFRAYTILQDPAPTPGVSGLMTYISVPNAAADELTVASYNMERFFDTTNDPSVSDVVLTAAAFANRLNKASLTIRNVMRSPDIVGVEEMENLPTLQALAAKINADSVTAGDPDPLYQAYLVEGFDIGGIDVGFLVKSSKVSVISVTQEAVGTYTEPGGATALLNDRPSLTMRVKVSRAKADDLLLTVLVNHLRSLSGVDDPVDGARVRAKRKAQAEFLANILQSYQAGGEKIVSVGDYNAFGFNDGYVDSMGTIMGSPTPADQVTLASPDLVDPNLTDLATLLPPAEQYSFNFDGNAQELDHVLVTQSALPLVTRFAIARVNSDFPEAYRNDPNRPERLSDHDPAVAYIQLPAQDFVPPVLTLPANITAEATSAAGASVTFTASALDAVTGPATVACSFSSGDTFPLGATTVNCSATDGHDNTATGSFTVTVVDTTAPTINITSPTNTTYTLNQVVNAGYACADLVGVVTCTGNVASGAAINTASTGTHTFTVNASDAAGNPSSASVNYTVTFAVCALYDQSQVKKAGSTVPIKLQLCDGSGRNYSSATTVVKATGLALIGGSSSLTADDSGNANPDGNFRYDPTLNGYIFNLSTQGLAAGTYALQFTGQGDATTHTVQFQLR